MRLDEITKESSVEREKDLALWVLQVTEIREMQKSQKWRLIRCSQRDVVKRLFHGESLIRGCY